MRTTWVGILLYLAGMPTATSAGAAALVPDLIATPVTALRSEVHDHVGTRQALLRFDSYIRNAGPGTLEITGVRPRGSAARGTLRMTRVAQVLRDERGGIVESRPSPARMTFEGIDGHRHWHVQAAQRLTLVTADGLAPVAAGAKIGFCLQDVAFSPTRPPADLDPRYRGCTGHAADGTRLGARGVARAAGVTMGISSGWEDLYDSALPFQWIHLTGVAAPGDYRVRAEVDPDGVVLEAEEGNPPAYSRRFRLRGWRAVGVVARPRPTGAPQRLRLRAERVIGRGLPRGDPHLGAPRAPLYRVYEGPRQGRLTLDARTGAAVYSPRPGYRGRDSFRFTAAEAGSLLARPVATVELRVGLRRRG